MLQHQNIDLGIEGGLPAGMTGTGFDITTGSTWRRALQISTELTAQRAPRRDIVDRTLKALRPRLDSPHANVRANATLYKDEWIELDTVVGIPALETLYGFTDLLGRGLRTNLGNPFATPVYEYQKVSEMGAANVTMYASTPPTDDRVQISLTGVPVPVISKGFFLDERTLMAGRQRGQPIDSVNAEAANRVVMEMLETLLFQGNSNIVHGTYAMTGLTNTTGVNTGSLTGSWATLATTAPWAILNDVITMKQACRSDYIDGPFMVYVPWAWIDLLGNDYFSSSAASPAAVTGLVSPTRTILERIMAVDGILGVRPTTQLTSGVLMVDMNRRTVDVIYGFEPRLISWESQGGMGNHFRVISIMSYRIRTDYAGHCGIAYYS